jgi:hypothetical protein
MNVYNVGDLVKLTQEAKRILSFSFCDSENVEILLIVEVLDGNLGFQCMSPRHVGPSFIFYCDELIPLNGS